MNCQKKEGEGDLKLHSSKHSWFTVTKIVDIVIHHHYTILLKDDFYEVTAFNPEKFMRILQNDSRSQRFINFSFLRMNMKWRTSNSVFHWLWWRHFIKEM